MPESVNPFDRKKTKAPVPPTPADKKQELLNRATGRSVLPTPPPAGKLPPGVTGNPPLPTGRVVGHDAPSSYTAAELAAMRAVGISESVELPKTAEGLKQLQQVIAAQQSVEVPLPVPLDTPPVKQNTVPLASLPPGQQKQVLNTIKGITDQEKIARQMASESQELAAREGRAKGLGFASKAAEQSVNAFRDRMAARQAPQPAAAEPEPEYEVNIGPGRDSAMEAREQFVKEYVQQPEAAVEARVGPVEEPAPSYQPQATAVSETGAAHATLTNCPHCNWDLSDVDVKEPDYSDKMGFMHSVLGLKPFTKNYSLFNGLMEVRFRTLTTREADKVYAQTFADKEAGKLPTDFDFWERLNRYRMILQIHTVKTSGPDGIFKELPDGYSASTNNTATGFYLQPEDEAKLGINKTGLPDIEEWMIDEILKTEHVFRAVNIQCNQFNRLASKMEVMIDNSDFWKPTEAQS